MLQKSALAIALFVTVALSACSGHKVDVQQGNIIDPELREALELGMTKQQVLFLLGNPVVSDPFHPDRWDYIYYLSEAGTIPEKSKRLTLHFKDDLLVRIVDDYFDTEAVPANVEPQADQAQ